jgi:hypothetical protein
MSLANVDWAQFTLLLATLIFLVWQVWGRRR